MNAGRKLQRDWRWNGKPLRIRIERLHSVAIGEWWRINWERQCPSGRVRVWRSYAGDGPLRDVISRYREYALEWRGR